MSSEPLVEDKVWQALGDRQIIAVDHDEKEFSGGRKFNGMGANVKFSKIIVKTYDVIGLDLDGKIRAWVP